MLNLGIVADEITRDFREAVRIGTSLGIRRYEIRFVKSGRAPMCDHAELREIEKIRDGEGVEITALSPGLFKWTDDYRKFQQEVNEIYPRAIDLAHRWGLSSLIIFSFCKPGATEENADTITGDQPPDWVFRALSEIAQKAENDNFQLLIEPEPVCFGGSALAAKSMIQRINSKNLRINYDPCNDAWTLRRDPINDFDHIASLISNVHIKDQLPGPIGSGMPKWVVPEQGMLDWKAHLKALKNFGYSGPMSLEPHLDGRVETIGACREAILRIWEEL